MHGRAQQCEQLTLGGYSRCRHHPPQIFNKPAPVVAALERDVCCHTAPAPDAAAPSCCCCCCVGVVQCQQSLQLWVQGRGTQQVAITKASRLRVKVCV